MTGSASALTFSLTIADGRKGLPGGCFFSRDSLTVSDCRRDYLRRVAAITLPSIIAISQMFWQYARRVDVVAYIVRLIVFE